MITTCCFVNQHVLLYWYNHLSQSISLYARIGVCAMCEIRNLTVNELYSASNFRTESPVPAFLIVVITTVVNVWSIIFVLNFAAAGLLGHGSHMTATAGRYSKSPTHYGTVMTLTAQMCFPLPVASRNIPFFWNIIDAPKDVLDFYWLTAAQIVAVCLCSHVYSWANYSWDLAPVNKTRFMLL